MIGQTHLTHSGQNYFVSPLHRMVNATADKCVWTIPVPEEIDCFATAINNTWFINDKCWGIGPVLSKNNLPVLGVNYESKDLSIAKFVQGAGQWHGYPADVNRRPHDRPHPVVLETWVANDIISKPYRARIQGGRI